jgi:hypothetical protein
MGAMHEIMEQDSLKLTQKNYLMQLKDHKLTF